MDTTDLASSPLLERLDGRVSDFTHFDAEGAARMVPVGHKPLTERVARASARVRMQPETLRRLQSGQMAKGDVLQVARLAGIMAAKRTGELVPLCHPIPIDCVELSFQFTDEQTVAVEAVVKATWRTGVEMEALVAASTAALTIYDMCKAVDRAMTIEQIRLEEKRGGKSGHFKRR